MDKDWDNILKGSLSELGIKPGYYIIVDENTGETKIVKEEYIVTERDGNKHLKLIHIIKIYNFKCPKNKSSKEYFSSFLNSSAKLNYVTNGLCKHYPYSLHEYRVLCETWLTEANGIFINGELENLRGKSYDKNCSKCETNYPVHYFMKPKKIMKYAKAEDPLVSSYYKVLKKRAQRIVNNDIKYKELTKSDILQFFINIIPDVLDLLFTREALPYGSFGPSYFVKNKLPNIDSKNTFYISSDEIEDAIKYFEKIKDEDYFNPDQIKY